MSMFHFKVVWNDTSWQEFDSSLSYEAVNAINYTEREKQIMCVWERDSTRVFHVHFNEKSSSYCVNSRTDITTLCYELQSSITACHMSLYGFFLSPFNWVIWHHSGTTSKRWHVCSIRYNANTRRRLNYLSFWIFFVKH